jgi:hypothetical protein
MQISLKASIFDKISCNYTLRKIYMLFKNYFRLVGLVLALFLFTQSLSAQDAKQPLLTVKEIMNGIITPTTATIWGAYELKTDEEWLEIQNAALTVIAAGNLLAQGGAGDSETEKAQEIDWQTFNNQMITAAREVLVAVTEQDEESLFNAGNNALYPPCESCHQKYQQQ